MEAKRRIFLAVLLGVNLPAINSAENWIERKVAGLSMELSDAPTRLNVAVPSALKNFEAYVVETTAPHCRITIVRSEFQIEVTSSLIENHIEGMLSEEGGFGRDKFSNYTSDVNIAGLSGKKVSVKRRDNPNAEFARFEFFVFSKGKSLWSVNFCYKDKSVYISDFAEELVKEISIED